MDKMIDRIVVAISGAPFPSKASLGKARKVLEVLRQPTTDMKMAGAEAITGDHMRKMANYDAACDGWNAMIEAAINE